MTRKQAVCEAIKILSNNKSDAQIIEKLQDILEELPMCSWTQKSILDTIENYSIEHNGKLPQLSKFTTENNLPSSTAIRSRFNLSINDLIAKYFPNLQKTSCFYSPYKECDEEYFKAIFISNYTRIQKEKQIKNVHYKTYNKYREQGTPNSATIMKKCNCKTYCELLIFCDLRTPKKDIEITYNVSFNDEDDSNSELISMINEI